MAKRYGVYEAQKDILSIQRAAAQQAKDRAEDLVGKGGDAVIRASANAAESALDGTNLSPSTAANPSPQMLDTLRSVLRAGAQEFSFNFADDAMGLSGAVGNSAQNALARTGLAPDTGRSFGQAFNDYSGDYRNRLEQFQRAHPDLDSGARIAGGLAQTAMAPELKVAGLVGPTGKVFQGAVDGGVKGAVAGWNEPSGGWGERATNAIENGAQGAAAGAFAWPLGNGIRIMSRPARAAAGAAGDSVLRAAAGAFRTAFPPLSAPPAVRSGLSRRQPW